MRNLQKVKQAKRESRHRKVRTKIFGTSKRPRLSVYRSLEHIYTQLINDEKGKTLISASDLELLRPDQKKSKRTKSLRRQRAQGKKEEMEKRSAKIAVAYEVGKLIGEKALKLGIKKCVFDRGGYKYHGRIKAVADGAREGGLKF